MKRHQILRAVVYGLFLTFLCLAAGGLTSGSAHAASAYDLSEWQGNISTRQARHLHHEVNFVILRAQHGTYPDVRYAHNANVMSRAHVPYGVYSYSNYDNSASARQEASSLYNRAPYANFYVNDIENDRARGRLEPATKAWAKQMKHLTSKPVVLYSYANFIGTHLRKAVKDYNAVWVADYSSRRPATGYHYNLWQFTGSHHSQALHKKVDASVTVGHKPLSFWTNGQLSQVNHVHHHHHHFNLLRLNLNRHVHVRHHHHHRRHHAKRLARLERRYLRMRRGYRRYRFD